MIAMIANHSKMKDVEKMRNLEELVLLQESYFENLLELGVEYENFGLYEEALEVYKKGIEKAEEAKKKFSAAMLGLI